MKAWTYDAESGAFGNWAAMVMVRVFSSCSESISYQTTWTVRKELFRRLLSIPSEVLLIADQTRKLVLQKRVGPHLLDTPSAALETSVRYEHKQRFPAEKGALSRYVQQFWRFFCRYKRNKEGEKNTFDRFRESKPKEVDQIYGLHHFWHMGAFLSPWQRWRRGASKLRNVHKLAVFHFACFSTWKLQHVQMQPCGVLGIDRRVFHCAFDEHDVKAISQRSNAW